MIQPAFIPEDRPQTVTVNGEGLLAWAKDARVHIYRMDVESNGVYKLHLLWLDGRELLTLDSPAPAEKPKMPTSAQKRERAREAQAEFFK